MSLVRSHSIIILLVLPAFTGIGWCETPASQAERVLKGSVDVSVTPFIYTLFNQVSHSATGENVLLSPIGPAQALSMTLNGAAAETSTDMRKALGLSPEMDPNTIHRHILDQLPEKKEGLELVIANSLWCRKGVKVSDSFQRLNSENYDANVESLDFSSPEAPKTINQWVSDKTGGLIPTIIDDKIDDSSILFLLSATYFKGLWAIPFDKDKTQEGEFTTSSGETLKVPMMRSVSTYRYVESSTSQVIELPYADGRIRMMIILPTESVDALPPLSLNFISHLRASLQDKEVSLDLPRFKMESQFDLDQPLTTMGMGIAFDPKKADFTKLTTPAREDLFIRKVRHKTFLTVDEVGTEAAAATSVEVSSRGIKRTFEMTVNRPFLFLILDSELGLPLFIGRVLKPALE